MITFEYEGDHVLLVYEPERGTSWIDERFVSGKTITIARSFTVGSSDLATSGDSYRSFTIGSIDGHYVVFRREVLGLKHDLLLGENVNLERKTFVAHRDISIFRKIDELVDEQIVVGGNRENSIPLAEFSRLLRTFPTSTELTRYSHSRVAQVLREYFSTMSDAERKLADHFAIRQRRENTSDPTVHGRIPAANALELAKLTYLRDRLAEMLKGSESYSEADWQRSVADLLLLIFPQYVAVLHSVHVKERYSNPSKFVDREIDLVLVNGNGCVDILEIKKPGERWLVSKRKYRDNHVPVRELSGAIMQAEKYLFYLSKSGNEGEARITAKYRDQLPTGLAIRITNPKALILTGRDALLSAREKFDLEFVRRQYSNVVDILSYDDLLRRLDNSIMAIKKRLSEDPSQVPLEPVATDVEDDE